ncbi:MAG: endonuclease NucS domain-containing protein [Gemmatimonadaceae bacterium]
MKACNRVMAARQSVYAGQSFQEGFIGVDYGIPVDLTSHLSENWKDFNREFIPVYLGAHAGKTRIAAGLACGFVWTMAMGLKEGDVGITPDGTGRYRAGAISGPYRYAADQILPHRRPVRWFSQPFDRSDMSEALQRSTNSTGTCCDVTAYGEELDRLIGGQSGPALIATDPAVEDASVFAMVKHLEDVLVSNWSNTELGKRYDIYTLDGEQVGQQFPSDTGPIDILAISKDGKELLVVELKKGRASDVVVGQTQRYMGYVLDELAEAHQTVKGVIIALDDDVRIRRALRVAAGIDFFRYQVNFTLIPHTA